MTQLACKEITEICTEIIVNFLKLQLEDVKEHVDDGQQISNHFLYMFGINKPKNV